jgi:regulatory protein
MKSSHQELEDLKTESERKTRSPTSLLARAIRYLSYREHSRFELRRKLLPFAQSEDELEGVIERLLKKDLLSNERFTENLVLRKAARYGARRIAQELGQHQIASETIVQELKQLQDSEESRAYVVWEHKFGGGFTHQLTLEKGLPYHCFLGVKLPVYSNQTTIAQMLRSPSTYDFS